MSISIIADIIGMFGTFAIVLAYFLIQLDKMDPKGVQYNVLNLVGAILLLISLCINFNLASFVIELFWIAASLVGLVRYYKKSNASLH
jgi:predicted membrane protein